MSVSYFCFSTNHFGQNIHFFIGCYFLESFGWNKREGPWASDRVANFDEFEHLCSDVFLLKYTMIVRRLKTQTKSRPLASPSRSARNLNTGFSAYVTS